ncbi:MAG: hypothetical protein CMP30_03690 [Roseibacillus sp.]|nr:hypothetical protein [Roseibacillus sp.]HCQ38006.1 hypothetical protein [Verrucomicrobiales bacterium]|tara:strand:- start:8581 stop:11103 length:2523 start_codon:yes stop_codon:yes gene_type:complete
MQFPPTNASLHTLSNGLPVIIQVDSNAPVISAQCWVSTGSQHENQFVGSGISHLLEHMVFKGTTSFTGAELATEVNSKGGQWNAYTSFDRTVYYIDGPSLSCDTFIRVLFELVFQPRFPAEDFETERDVIRREIDMGKDDPDSVASELLFRTFFQHDPRRHPVIGHRRCFDALTYDDMVGYHRGRYYPTNCIFVLSGDFDPDKALSALEKMGESLPFKPLEQTIVSGEPRQIGQRIERMPFTIPVSKTTLAWKTPGLDHPDSPALELLAGVLGGGRSSHLYRRFHEKEGIAHHLGAWAWSPVTGPGMFSISAEVDFEKRDQLEKEILTELTPTVGSELQSALDKARRQVFAQQFKTLGTASGRATDLASNWHEARNLNFTRDYLLSLDHVTIEDLHRVSQQYLSPDQATITSLDPHRKSPEARTGATSRQKPEITTRVLGNGLTLLLRSDPRVPTVSFQGVFNTGRHVETPENCGINLLHASLLTKGTHNYSEGEYADRVESLGANIRASAGNNTSIISSFCLAPDLSTVLGLSGEALSSPIFNEGSVQREKEVQRADLLESLQDPLKTSFRLLRESLFGYQDYGLPRLGTEESLNKIDREMLKKHHQQFITPQNGVLAVFGDINPQETIELCDQFFGGLPQGRKSDSPGAKLPQPASMEISHYLDKEQTVIAIGYPGAHITSEDVPALEVIHEYCSNMAGPLFTRMREELGLAYYVNATQFLGFGKGLFAFYVGTAPEKASLARKELLAQIEILTQEGIPDAALSHTKTSVLAGDALENQSNQSMAQMCALNTLFGLGPLHHLTHTEKIQSLSREDVMNTAQKYFGRKPVVVSVGPEPS